MGIQEIYVLGRESRNVTMAETALATFIQPTPGGSFVAKKIEIKPSREDEDRRFTSAQRSLLEVVEGNYKHEWSASIELLPRGGALPPDARQFLRCGFGSETIGGSSVTYGLSAAQTGPLPFQLWCENAGLLGRMAKGCFVEELKFAVANDSYPMFDASGFFAVYAEAGRATATANIATAATSFTPTPTNDHWKFDVDAIIQIGTDNNSGTGYRITAINRTSGLITFSPALAGAGGSAQVLPYTPFAFGASGSGAGGSPIPTFRNTATIGGVSLLFAGCDVSIKHNWSEVRPVGNQSFADANPGYREVSGTIKGWGRATELRQFAYAKSSPGTAVNRQTFVLTMGDTAVGSFRAVMTINNMQLNMSGIDTSNDQEGLLEIPFKCFPTTSTAENEIQLVTDTVV